MRARLIVLLCITIGSSTFSFGSFPALLPDLDRVVGLSNVELGALTSAFGFARMVLDVPVGLFVTRRLGWALLGAPVLLVSGISIIGTGGPLAVLMLGRVLMGFAHALGMVAALTTILRYRGGTLGASLNAFEFSAMLGMLGGVAVVAALPKALAWNHAYLIACAPVVLGLVSAPLVVACLGAMPTAAVKDMTAVVTAPIGRDARGTRHLVALAFVTGCAIAITYSTIEQFLIPLRASREFGLDRVGVARILMIAQLCDITALPPVGLVADRIGARRVLMGVLLSFAVSALLVSFGGVAAIWAGAACYGLGMAGWMLPLAFLRRGTPAAAIPWRTAVYRVGVDGGLFVGPFVSGLLGDHAWVLASACSAGLVVLALILFAHRADPR